MSADATVAQILHRRVSAHLRLSFALSGEIKALLALLALALGFRLIDLRGIEPNVLPDEADHVALIYRILAGYGPGPFDLSWDGNPAFSLYPAIPFVAAAGGSPIGLRVAVALASVLMLGAFYAVCRLRCAPPAALAATGLLAFSQWALFFSRNGEVNVFVALYAMLAVWSTQRALDTGDRRLWALAGFWAGMGWYGFLAGVLILPCLLAPLPIWLVTRTAERRQVLAGVGIVLFVFSLTVAPRVPTLVSQWDEVQTYIAGRAVTQYTPAAGLRSTLLQNAATTVRAFVLFDPTLEGNPRYMGRGRAVMDAVSATLAVIGVVLAVRRFAASALWFSFLIIPIVVTQVPTIGIPDVARAILALPAYFLFVGFAIERLWRLIPVPAFALAATLVTVVATSWHNWQAYGSWVASAASAAARQPAIDYDELPRWQAAQMEQAAVGLAGLTVGEWREANPRSTRARTRVVTRPAEGGLIASQPALAVQATTGANAPRGAAAMPDGQIVVAEPGGRLLRLDEAARSLSPVSLPPQVGGGQIWDLAASADGSLYLLDSERGAIFKVGPDGGLQGTFGADWGMYRPRGLDVGPDGQLYVADTGRNRIVVASPDGKIAGTIGGGAGSRDLEQPTDVAVGQDGRLYVALPELARLEVLAPDGESVGGWRIVKGNTIDSPRVAFTPDGTVAVTEPQERRVRLFDPDGTPLGRVEGGLGMPFGLAALGDSLVVTDPAAGRVLVYELVTR